MLGVEVGGGSTGGAVKADPPTPAPPPSVQSQHTCCVTYGKAQYTIKLRTYPSRPTNSAVGAATSAQERRAQEYIGCLRRGLSHFSNCAVLCVGALCCVCRGPKRHDLSTILPLASEATCKIYNNVKGPDKSHPVYLIRLIWIFIYLFISDLQHDGLPVPTWLHPITVLVYYYYFPFPSCGCMLLLE